MDKVNSTMTGCLAETDYSSPVYIVNSMILENRTASKQVKVSIGKHDIVDSKICTRILSILTMVKGNVSDKDLVVSNMSNYFDNTAVSNCISQCDDVIVLCLSNKQRIRQSENILGVIRCSDSIFDRVSILCDDDLWTIAPLLVCVPLTNVLLSLCLIYTSHLAKLLEQRKEDQFIETSHTPYKNKGEYSNNWITRPFEKLVASQLMLPGCFTSLNTKQSTSEEMLAGTFDRSGENISLATLHIAESESYQSIEVKRVT